MSRPSVSSTVGKRADVRGKRARKIRRAVEAARDKGLSRLAVHLVERGTIAMLSGESAEHWCQRQLHKQYDEEGRKRIEGVIQDIRDANMWPWS
mgnify:CR=1 FL=1